MRRRAVPARLLATVAVLGSVLLVAGAAGAAGDVASPSAGSCPSRAHLDARTMPAGTDVVRCGLVGAWYDAGDVMLQVPPPGYGVRGHGIEAARTGSAPAADSDAQLSVAPSGRLAAPPADKTSTSSTAKAPSVAAAATSPCSDSSYALWDEKWFHGFNWYVNFANRPSNISNADTAAALKRAMSNITGEKDSCGYADGVSLSATYKGSTSIGNSVGQVKNANGVYVIRCGTGDTHTVTNFGDIPSSFVAYTCDWVTYQDGPDSTISADIKYNVHDVNFTQYGASSGCKGKYDLESVATHEFGHLAGLGHVTGSAHANLTMYPTVYYCDTRNRTLARGDVLGLRQKY
jgi:hypothetical protein